MYQFSIWNFQFHIHINIEKINKIKFYILYIKNWNSLTLPSIQNALFTLPRKFINMQHLTSPTENSIRQKLKLQNPLYIIRKLLILIATIQNTSHNYPMRVLRSLRHINYSRKREQWCKFNTCPSPEAFHQLQPFSIFMGSYIVPYVNLTCRLLFDSIDILVLRDAPVGKVVFKIAVVSWKCHIMLLVIYCFFLDV